VTHTILVVFPHPDDEFSVGPLLAKCAAEGHAVHLVSITSGQKGYRTHANIPAGETLGAAREEELRRAAAALGIREPIFWGFQDGDISGSALADAIGARLRELIDTLAPDILITFGPDGLSGHADHRVSSYVVTEVFQHQYRLKHKPRKLYYTAIPESLCAVIPPPFDARLRATSDSFITTAVDCAEFLDRAFAAVKCHTSQWPPERMEEFDSLNRKVLGGHVFLRLALPCPTQRETSLFDGF
jgi:LmbE family N-acetylglucosaminyl deacetylase